jgi:hypothetical protein
LAFGTFTLVLDGVMMSSKIWVVTQQGIPIMAYNQSEVTPLELWEKHLGCSVFDVEVQ